MSFVSFVLIQRRYTESKTYLAVTRSRFARLEGRMRTNTPSQRLLAAVVVGHLIVSIVHGAAHSEARIPTTLAANLFIWIVILAGPLAGLWMSLSRPVAGGWIVAATMAGSLVFGVVNH